jgi:hypothetical protein
MATSTATRPARSAAKATAPAPKRPARRVPAPDDVPEILKGVVSKPARPSRTSASFVDVAKAVASEKPAKAPKAPKVNVNEVKNALAALIVTAAGDAIAKAPKGTFDGIDDPLELASRWLHYLPVGATWPEGKLPVPPRSEWNADGTRV